MAGSKSNLPIDRLHAVVDELAAPIKIRHAERLKCRLGCSACCVDDLTVFEVEAETIRLHYPDLLTHEAPHPTGACAFLDSADGCRIYPHRPYVCRTQGLPLRWVEEGNNGEPVEYRDICPLNEEGPDIASLPAEACWSIGPVEQKLAEMQGRKDGGEERRIALRDLFDHKDIVLSCE
ncbi:MAG: YkgJ family cysteine cluster protein [candidate division Zixibacteria bacterium]|nr:YkgJ family cysteine cluster protein [candidate division Zixibacteria bacterium]